MSPRRCSPQPRRRASSCRSALFVVLVGAARRGLTLNPREVPSPLIGKPAPAFELPLLHDARRRRSRPKTCCGKVWMLNVWASWCVSCRDEHPVLMELARTRRRADLRAQLQGRAAQDAHRVARALRRSVRLSAYDAKGRVGIDYGVYGVPETYVIDKRRRHPLQADRPRARREVLRDKILPLVRELRRVMR